MSKEVVKAQVWVKGQNDAEFRNNVGFFRDPFTGEMFDETTINVERVPGNKYAHIYASDGKTSIPLSFKFWTRQEKDDYYNSRKNPGFGTGSGKLTRNNELRQSLLNLQKYLADNGKMDPTIEKMINDLLPPDPEVEKMQKQVANMTEEQKALLKSLLG